MMAKKFHNSQPELFPEIERPPAELEPRGFRYQEDIISLEEEIALAAAIDQIHLKPFEFHGYVANRRVVSFGMRYDFGSRRIEAAEDMPAFLNDLLGKAAKFAGCDEHAFRQVGINEYRTGAGVGWHKDKPQFGIVVGVSLLAPATMRFRKSEGVGWKRISHTLQPRSIYILSEEARTEWEHSIPPVSQLRYSINFRTRSELATTR
jgi:alkylated DNA repair dioxygenase AlkB